MLAVDDSQQPFRKDRRWEAMMRVALLLCSLVTFAFSFHNHVGTPPSLAASFSKLEANSKIEGGTYLGYMVERKKIEVENLLRRHQEPDDPLVMRMSYMASECKLVPCAFHEGFS